MILPEIDDPILPEAGTRNLWIRNRLLHSRFDPDRELSRFLSANLDPLPDGARLLLIGAGGLEEMLLPSAARLTLTLFEPIAALRPRYADLALSLSGPDVGEISAYDHVIILPAYRRLFPDWAEALDAVLHPQAADHRGEKGAGTALPASLDGRTQAHFLRLWMRNYAMRTQPPLRARGGERQPQPGGNASPGGPGDSSPSLAFFNGIAPRPSTLLFCGAGPGLIEDLRAVENAAGTKNPPGTFVAVADTAAAAVLHAGWRIDCILSVDSGPGTSYHLALVPPDLRPHLPVLTWLPGSSYLERAGFPCVFVPTLFPLDQWLSASLPLPVAWTNPFRNVMGYAFTLQKRCEIPSLALAGCGFHERHGTYYTRGTGYALFHDLQSGRLNPLETLDRRLTRRQRGANRQAARLLGEHPRETVPPTVRAAPEVGRAPPVETQAPGQPRPPFRLLQQHLAVTEVRNRLASTELPRNLERDFGPQWANLYRRLRFCD